LEKYYKESYKDVKEEFQTDLYNGLSEKEVKKRIEKYGKNEITIEQKVSALEIFINQFKDIIIALLFVASAISFFMGDVVESIAILVVIILTA